MDVSGDRQAGRFRIAIGLVAIAHVAVLASVALFPIPMLHRFPNPFPDGWINLVPFATIGPVLAGHGSGSDVSLLILNTFVLLPAGIYVPLLVPPARTIRGLIVLTIVGGASIEAAQTVMIAIVGMPYRSIDIDDAILNAIGLVIGWFLTCRVLAVRPARPAPIETSTRRRASPSRRP
jgi:glycopeptide antibiotics resistance protein